MQICKKSCKIITSVVYIRFICWCLQQVAQEEAKLDRILDRRLYHKHIKSQKLFTPKPLFRRNTIVRKYQVCILAYHVSWFYVVSPSRFWGTILIYKLQSLLFKLYQGAWKIVLCSFDITRHISFLSVCYVKLLLACVPQTV